MDFIGSQEFTVIALLCQVSLVGILMIYMSVFVCLEIVNAWVVRVVSKRCSIDGYRVSNILLPSTLGGSGYSSCFMLARCKSKADFERYEKLMNEMRELKLFPRAWCCCWFRD